MNAEMLIHRLFIEAMAYMYLNLSIARDNSVICPCFCSMSAPRNDKYVGRRILMFSLKIRTDLSKDYRL